MEKKTVLDGNILIKNYMGSTIVIDNCEYVFERDLKGSLRFHDSWDWLMAVVNKIFDDFNTNISEETRRIIHPQVVGIIYSFHYYLDIKNTWKKVVKYIKRYNKICNE